MTEDEVTGDEMTEDEVTGDEMTEDEVTGDEMTCHRQTLSETSPEFTRKTREAYAKYRINRSDACNGLLKVLSTLQTCAILVPD
ncbi:hypothetical protein BgiMline_026101, partial [Biomphalaria glabrata]